MEISQALDAFSALSQPTRLDVFRLLMETGEDGMAAGAISSTLGVRQNTLSANLAILARSGLICSERRGRSIHYAIDRTGVRGLVGFLLEECCGGRPELCRPILDDLAGAAARRAPK